MSQDLADINSIDPSGDDLVSGGKQSLNEQLPLSLVQRNVHFVLFFIIIDQISKKIPFLYINIKGQVL